MYTYMDAVYCASAFRNDERIKCNIRLLSSFLPL